MRGDATEIGHRPALDGVGAMHTVRDATRHAMWVALVPISTWLFLVLPALQGRTGMDSAHAYWNVWRLAPYSTPPGTQDAFNYTPAAAHLFLPLTLLPWPGFLALWTATLLTALAWVVHPITPKWRTLVFLLAVPQVVTLGNLEALFALVAAVGLRWPAAWALPLLTKLTPGLGPVWFAARGEWRRMAIATLTTALLVAVSCAVEPHLWVRWAQFLHESPTPPTQVFYPPLWARAVAGLTLLLWGARTNRVWTLPVAMVLCTPLLSLSALVVLTAIPRLREQEHRVARTRAVRGANHAAA